MKTLIAFTLGAWFGFGICAIFSANQNNKYEQGSGYNENGYDLLPTDGNLHDSGGKF